MCFAPGGWGRRGGVCWNDVVEEYRVKIPACLVTAACEGTKRLDCWCCGGGWAWGAKHVAAAVVAGVHFVSSTQVPRCRLPEIIRHSLWHICRAASLQQILRSLHIFRARPATTPPTPQPPSKPLSPSEAYQSLLAEGARKERSWSRATGPILLSGSCSCSGDTEISFWLLHYSAP